MRATGLVVIFLALSVPARAASDPVDMAAAKSEGTVRWYTSTPVATAQNIANRFEKDTGVKVELFRSGGSAVLSRFMQELNAGAIQADVLTTSDPAAAATLAKQGIFVAFKPANFDKIPAEVKDESGFWIAQRLNLLAIAVKGDAVKAAAAATLAKQGIFVAFKPANFDKIPAEVKDESGYWIAQRLNLLAIAVKGDAVKAADRPKTWSDLTDPKYKGLEVMPDPSFTSLQLVAVGTLAKKLGWEFYDKLKRNDVMIVQGHQQVEDMVKRGERPIAAEELDSYADDDRKAGHDIVTIYPSEGVFAIASPTAIVKGGPHPNAAKLFTEFMIGDSVQNSFAQEGIYAARVDAPPPAGSPALQSLKLMPIDFAGLAQDEGTIKSRFNEIFQ